VDEKRIRCRLPASMKHGPPGAEKEMACRGESRMERPKADRKGHKGGGLPPGHQSGTKGAETDKKKTAREGITQGGEVARRALSGNPRPTINGGLCYADATLTERASSQRSSLHEKKKRSRVRNRFGTGKPRRSH